MKNVISTIMLFISLQGLAQSAAETKVLALSAQIFTWETENKTAFIEKAFHDKCTIVNSAGEVQTKEQYLTVLKSGKFVHDTITVEHSSAIVVNNTATVFGKGRFVISNSGKQIAVRLIYMEVFTRPGDKGNWKLLAIHASKLVN